MTDLLSKIFIKKYRETTNPAVRTAYGTMVSIVGILFNVLLFAAKFSVGTIFASVSITADAVNNLSDAASQIISLISFRIAAKPADREHPFGHGRIEYVASMLVSFLVIYIGIDLFTESIGKILSGEKPEASWVSVGVLGGSILVKLWLALFNRKIGKRIDSSVMRATAVDCISDVISTSAVLISTLILLLAPSLDLNLDAYMGVIVAGLIIFAGLKILNETKNSILGEAPSDEIVEKIYQIVKAEPQALGIHDLVVHNYGPGHVVAALHVEVDGKVDIFRTHDMVDTLERRLRQECGIEATIHMDPIVTDDETVSRLREQVTEAVVAIDTRLNIHDFRFVTGVTHSNLIFDVVAPFELEMSDEELKRAIADRISRIDPSYFTVVTVDRN